MTARTASLPPPAQVEQESERIGKDAMECQVIADDAQADLAVAMPALEKAMIEVDKLDKTAITEVFQLQLLSVNLAQFGRYFILGRLRSAFPCTLGWGESSGVWLG